MKESWFKGLKTKAEREQRKKELQGARHSFDLLDQQLEALKKPEANRDYNNPNWAYNQIAHNEWNTALEKIRELINTKE